MEWLVDSVAVMTCGPSNWSGGGGGYSGGPGGGSYAGGGGSFNAGTSQNNEPGMNSGHGKVVITYIAPSSFVLPTLE